MTFWRASSVSGIAIGNNPLSGTGQAVQQHGGGCRVFPSDGYYVRDGANNAITITRNSISISAV
jgi:hypothetical protein